MELGFRSRLFEVLIFLVAGFGLEMATVNPFDLLGDDDNDDPSHLIAAAQQQKIAQPKKILALTQAPAQQAKPAKLPAKPLPPAQAGKLNSFSCEMNKRIELN